MQFFLLGVEKQTNLGRSLLIVYTLIKNGVCNDEHVKHFKIKHHWERIKYTTLSTDLAQFVINETIKLNTQSRYITFSIMEWLHRINVIVCRRQ